MSRKLKIWVFFQVIHIITLLVFRSFVTLDYLFIFSGLYSLLNYLRYIIGLNKNNLSPIKFYIIGSIIRLGITTIYYGFVLLNGFELQLGRIVTTENALEGLIILLLGDLLFITGYSIFVSLTNLKTGAEAKPKVSAGLTLYLVSALVSYANFIGV